MSEDQSKIVVTVDIDLEDIVPMYLERRRTELAELNQSVANQDFENLRILGHRMKGSGAGYGFEEITNIGRDIEAAAKEEKAEPIQQQVDHLANYLDRVEVIFEEEEY